MYRRIINLLTLGAFAVYSIGLTGCTKLTRLSVDEAIRSESCQVQHTNELKGGNIVAVYTPDKVYRFEKNFAYINTASQTIEGYSLDNKEVSIPLTEVTSIEIKSTDWTKTLLLAGAGIGICVALAIAAYEPEQGEGWSLLE
ncbi:MAG: hypothetical protein JSU74_13425 [Candidatus Zixiibacteriota bacterium]|nr:MAG: hypothetical protein JSU74_13425 [candidate division Zixibacteria bacterium]